MRNAKFVTVTGGVGMIIFAISGMFVDFVGIKDGVSMIMEAIIAIGLGRKIDRLDLRPKPPKRIKKDVDVFTWDRGLTHTVSLGDAEPEDETEYRAVDIEVGE